MKDIYEVLRQKEHDRSRLEKEVEALRVAAPLLAGDEDKEARNAGNENEPASPVSTAPQPIRIGRPAVNASPQLARAVGWEDRAKHWP